MAGWKWHAGNISHWNIHQGKAYMLYECSVVRHSGSECVTYECGVFVVCEKLQCEMGVTDGISLSLVLIFYFCVHFWLRPWEKAQSAALEVAAKFTHSFRRLMSTYSYDNSRSLCLIIDRRMEATIFTTLHSAHQPITFWKRREEKAQQQGDSLKMPSKRNQKATKIIIGNFNNAISRCPVSQIHAG
jgi:hypothetical protein